MKILFSDDYLIDENFTKKESDYIIFGQDRLQIYLQGHDEVQCYTYHELVCVTIEILKETIKTRLLVLDINTGTRFRLNLNIQTIKDYFELQVDLTEEELKKLFELLDYQKIVVHDPIKLRDYFKSKEKSLQAFVAKRLEELYPIK